jgi:hypothetical protein
LKKIGIKSNISSAFACEIDNILNSPQWIRLKKARHTQVAHIGNEPQSSLVGDELVIAKRLINLSRQINFQYFGQWKNNVASMDAGQSHQNSNAIVVDPLK